MRTLTCIEVNLISGGIEDSKSSSFLRAIHLAEIGGLAGAIPSTAVIMRTPHGYSVMNTEVATPVLVGIAAGWAAGVAEMVAVALDDVSAYVNSNLKRMVLG